MAGLLTTSLNALFSNTLSNGLLDFLRIFSFWTMKSRARTVGANGLAPFLASLLTTAAQDNPTMCIHLMGHSFGAKLLTAALYGTTTIEGTPSPVVDTLILCQGAFSQFSFTRDIPDNPDVSGFYVDVVEKGLEGDPLVGIHNDYTEPELFQAAFMISQLKRT